MILDKTYNTFNLGNEGLAFNIPKVIINLLKIDASSPLLVVLNEESKEIRYYLNKESFAGLPKVWTLVSQVAAIRGSTKENLVRLVATVPISIVKRFELKPKQKLQLEINIEENFFAIKPLP